MSTERPVNEAAHGKNQERAALAERWKKKRDREDAGHGAFGISYIDGASLHGEKC